VARSHACTLLICILFASCGPSVVYRDNVPLSDVTATVPDREGVVLRLPRGWEAVSAGVPETTEGYSVLMRCGDSLRISVREISLDAPAADYFRKKGMSDLAALTRTLHDSSRGVSGKGITEFSYGGRKFAAFEYGGTGGPQRVVVFAVKEKYYECEAFSVRPLSGRSSYDALFSAQQTVLRSLK